MLLTAGNPKANLDVAENVYALYAWVDRFTGKPTSELILTTLRDGGTVREVIKEIHSKIEIDMYGNRAMLRAVYIDNQTV